MASHLLSLQLVSDYVVKPITRIINLPFLREYSPNELKIALVSPLSKDKDRLFFSNYRPICFLLIFDRLMYNRILQFLHNHRMLNEYQFGFRNNHRTYMALMIRKR